MRTNVFAKPLSGPNKYSCTKAGKGKRRATRGREKEGGGTFTLAATFPAFTRYKHQRESYTG